MEIRAETFGDKCEFQPKYFPLLGSDWMLVKRCTASPPAQIQLSHAAVLDIPTPQQQGREDGAGMSWELQPAHTFPLAAVPGGINAAL